MVFGRSKESEEVRLSRAIRETSTEITWVNKFLKDIEEANLPEEKKLPHRKEAEAFLASADRKLREAQERLEELALDSEFSARTAKTRLLMGQK